MPHVLCISAIVRQLKRRATRKITSAGGPMKTILISIACIAGCLTASAASAMDICVQSIGDGCRDLSSGKLYYPSGNKLVDPETKRVFMQVEPVKPSALKGLERLGASPSTKMDADLQKPVSGEATARRADEALNEQKPAGDARQINITIDYRPDEAEEPPSYLLIMGPEFSEGRTRIRHIGTRHDRMVSPAGSHGEKGDWGSRSGPATPSGMHDQDRQHPR